MAGPILSIDIDSSEIQAEIDYLRNVLSAKRFEHAIEYVFRQTSRHVKTIIKKDVPMKYHVRASDFTNLVKTPVTVMEGSNVSCVIPLKGKRKSIGGSFTASGSARGWESLHKKYRVTAMIVKGASSKLPTNMAKYGGMPPFRNIPSKLGSATFTRTGKGRFPIKAVVGIAVPQMPMTRSRDEVTKDIDEYMINRLEHRIIAFWVNGR